MNNITIKTLFRYREGNLPSIEKQFRPLWRIAKYLESAGLPLDGWHPAAPTPKESLSHKAFNESGPSGDAIALANSNNVDTPDHPTVGVANGKDDAGGVWFTNSLSVKAISDFDFSANDVRTFFTYASVADLVEEIVKIYPASLVEVGPYTYYADDKQVFPNRPGVGWMLYLPHEISHDQVPEAQMLRHVTDANGHKGTIIISEIDGMFSVDNPAHVHTANKIEIRLADCGLLPKYADL